MSAAGETGVVIGSVAGVDVLMDENTRATMADHAVTIPFKPYAGKAGIAVSFDWAIAVMDGAVVLASASFTPVGGADQTSMLSEPNPQMKVTGSVRKQYCGEFHDLPGMTVTVELVKAHIDDDVFAAFALTDITFELV